MVNVSLRLHEAVSNIDELEAVEASRFMVNVGRFFKASFDPAKTLRRSKKWSDIKKGSSLLLPDPRKLEDFFSKSSRSSSMTSSSSDVSVPLALHPVPRGGRGGSVSDVALDAISRLASALDGLLQTMSTSPSSTAISGSGPVSQSGLSVTVGEVRAELGSVKSFLQSKGILSKDQSSFEHEAKFGLVHRSASLSRSSDCTGSEATPSVDGLNDLNDSIELSSVDQDGSILLNTETEARIVDVSVRAGYSRKRDIKLLDDKLVLEGFASLKCNVSCPTARKCKDIILRTSLHYILREKNRKTAVNDVRNIIVDDIKKSCHGVLDQKGTNVRWYIGYLSNRHEVCRNAYEFTWGFSKSLVRSVLKQLMDTDPRELSFDLHMEPISSESEDGVGAKRFPKQEWVISWFERFLLENCETVVSGKWHLPEHITVSDLFRMCCWDWMKLKIMTGTQSLPSQWIAGLKGVDIEQVPDEVPIEKASKVIHDAIKQTRVGQAAAERCRAAASRSDHEVNGPTNIATASSPNVAPESLPEVDLTLLDNDIKQQIDQIRPCCQSYFYRIFQKKFSNVSTPLATADFSRCTECCYMKMMRKLVHRVAEGNPRHLSIEDVRSILYYFVQMFPVNVTQRYIHRYVQIAVRVWYQCRRWYAAHHGSVKNLFDSNACAESIRNEAARTLKHPPSKRDQTIKDNQIIPHDVRSSESIQELLNQPDSEEKGNSQTVPSVNALGSASGRFDVLDVIGESSWSLISMTFISLYTHRRKNHILASKLERIAYNTRMLSAHQSPDSVTLITLDLTRPFFIPSAVAKHSYIKQVEPFKIMCGGLTNFSTGKRSFFMNSTKLSKSANLIATILYFEIMATKTSRGPASRSRVLTLQVDGGSENINKTVFALAQLLVALKWYDVVYMHRLVVGHTHQYQDAMFAVIRKAYRSKDVMVLYELINSFIRSFKINKPEIVWIENVINFHEYFFAGDNPIANKKMKGIKGPLGFKFAEWKGKSPSTVDSAGHGDHESMPGPGDVENIGSDRRFAKYKSYPALSDANSNNANGSAWLSPGANPDEAEKGIQVLLRVPGRDEIPTWIFEDSTQVRPSETENDAKNKKNEQAVEELLRWHINSHKHPEEADWLSRFVRTGDTGIRATNPRMNVQELNGCGLPAVIHLAKRSPINVKLIDNMELNGMWDVPQLPHQHHDVVNELNILNSELCEIFVAGKGERSISVNISDLLDPSSGAALGHYVEQAERGDYIATVAEHTDIYKDVFWVGQVIEGPAMESVLHKGRISRWKRQRQVAEYLKLPESTLTEGVEAYSDDYEPGDVMYIAVRWLTKVKANVNFGKYKWAFIHDKVPAIMRQRTSKQAIHDFKITIEDVSWISFLPADQVVLRFDHLSFGPVGTYIDKYEVQKWSASSNHGIAGDLDLLFFFRNPAKMHVVFEHFFADLKKNKKKPNNSEADKGHSDMSDDVLDVTPSSDPKPSSNQVDQPASTASSVANSTRGRGRGGRARGRGRGRSRGGRGRGRGRGGSGSTESAVPGGTSDIKRPVASSSSSSFKSLKRMKLKSDFASRSGSCDDSAMSDMSVSDSDAAPDNLATRQDLKPERRSTRVTKPVAPFRSGAFSKKTPKFDDSVKPQSEYGADSSSE